MINNSGQQYDDMKKFIGLMKEQQSQSNIKSKRQQLLNEDERDLTDIELQTERDELGNAVSKPVDIISFKVYSDNIEMVFKLIKEDIEVTFSMDDPEGLYITSREIIQLNNNMLQTFQELKSYYDIWSEKWGDELSA